MTVWGTSREDFARWKEVNRQRLEEAGLMTISERSRLTAEDRARLDENFYQTVRDTRSRCNGGLLALHPMEKRQ